MNEHQLKMIIDVLANNLSVIHQENIQQAEKSGLDDMLSQTKHSMERTNALLTFIDIVTGKKPCYEDVENMRGNFYEVARYLPLLGITLDNNLMTKLELAYVQAD
ncbi:hypothetical protein [Photobacterium leiognathi]|uniref:hypothetical protein n=1 Tax=Photobacterium leiognathi TaxID=553611 RepID=UPI00298180E1|nr:hypothetical protein [Photobacterium leiognathi]